MNEKIYRTMGITGAGNVAIGVVVLTLGLVTGILSIVCGAMLLKNRSSIIF